MECCSCYVTVGGRDEALAIGRALVEERLAACVNVVEGVTSIYRWEGAIREDPEVVLFAKTRRELVERLTQRVRELHSYDVPCVVALPLQGGNPAFLEWIAAETTGA